MRSVTKTQTKNSRTFVSWRVTSHSPPPLSLSPLLTSMKRGATPKMATASDITDLFWKLATHLQTQAHTSPELNEGPPPLPSDLELSISKLSQSLNLAPVSSVRVLDAALSLSCFKAPQVFDTTIRCLVSTLITVLSSSISCKALGFEKGEVLQIGSSISARDCFQLIEFVIEAIPKLESHGVPSDLLLRAVVRVAVSSCCYRCLPLSMSSFDSRSVEEGNAAISKLVQHFPRGEFTVKDHEMPLRLLLWYLEPLILKNDVSTILQETINRPFLRLSKEFYERTYWRHIVICLVLSPVMFINSHALLHHWFLLTGLDAILEILAELVSVMLDVISRPTWWGISMGLSSKLPFSNAYFPCRNHLSRALAGPLSTESFLQLVNEIGKEVSLTRRQLDPNIRPSAVMIKSLDHKSIWALAINFPDWFYFASVILFFDGSSEEKLPFRSTFGVPKIGQTNCMESPPAASAARYLAWILSPVDKHHEDLLFDGLKKISWFWTSKRTKPVPLGKVTAACSKKLKKPKFSYNDKKFTQTDEFDGQFISVFLENFHSMVKTGNEAVDSSTCTDAEFSVLVPQHNILLRRILLGILIGCHRHINEDGCELLLNYAATGRILHPQMSNNPGMKHLKQNFGGSKDKIMDYSEWIRKDAAAGACLVFSLTDIVERMSTSLCESEEDGVDMICWVKLRASSYLIKRIKMLTQAQSNANVDRLMLMDLRNRLEQWKHQGKEILELQNDLDNAMKILSTNISSV